MRMEAVQRKQHAPHPQRNSLEQSPARTGGTTQSVHHLQTKTQNTNQAQHTDPSTPTDTARDAIRSADSTAEREAEKDRDYQAEEDRKRQAEEARDDLKRNRATVRALIADVRELCPTDLPTTYPAAAAAVKRQLADLLKDRSDLFDQLNTLES